MRPSELRSLELAGPVQGPFKESGSSSVLEHEQPTEEDGRMLSEDIRQGDATRVSFWLFPCEFSVLRALLVCTIAHWDVIESN